MSLSTVPLVLTALVALARDVLPNTVDLFDGQPDRDVADETVVIGFTGDPLAAAVEDTRSVEEITRERDRERYEITCLATSWLGEGYSVEEVRARVFSFVDGISSRIAQDHTMGGVCGKSRVSTVAVAQAQTNTGPVVTVMFTVFVDAFTRRA